MAVSEHSSWVVVIEDDNEIRRLLGHMLEERYNVVTACHGQDAIDKIKAMPIKPCIVFLDLMMPVMDGWAFLKYSEQNQLLPEVQVIVISAHPTQHLPKSIDFLPKPFNINSIEALCDACCTHKLPTDKHTQTED